MIIAHQYFHIIGGIAKYHHSQLVIVTVFGNMCQHLAHYLETEFQTTVDPWVWYNGYPVAVVVYVLCSKNYKTP